MECALFRKVFLFVIVIGLAVLPVLGEEIPGAVSLENGMVKCSIFTEKRQLMGDRLEALSGWKAANSNTGVIESDADFGVDIMWTGWRAPGKVHNADNPVMLTKSEFIIQHHNIQAKTGEYQQAVFNLKHRDSSLQVRLFYRLEDGAFFVKRKLEVMDSGGRNHFLRWIWPRRGLITGDVTILKSGGFGRPLALLLPGGAGGAFFGMEYPAAENHLKPISKGKTRIKTGQEMGMKIFKKWISSEWSVTGLTPDAHVKLWFNRYLERVRVAPLKPYLLYNTWYDVRSPEYTDRPEDVMNEANLLRIIADFKREMVEKRGLKLDAFVLDDAWDIYKSDWVLRKKEFPNGLKPIADALKGMGTDLGIWFGPTGGYSYRKWRVNWMVEHGYEAEDDQLCLAGTNYRKLFKTRTTDFVANDRVAYFKWDGIQFSCSEPDHGHPLGIYSRRAVMESVVDLCAAVRKINPDMYLNITSGTWLSPWWMKYANMIWMQGYDYGYADVPSISTRDGAITYRDFVLYEDFGINDFWFPISNLMTHGIIKGHLQKLGGEAEPLDKFTDNAILYFARGVAMWELYISPNLLSDGEWDAIAKSVRWAKDRFELLKQTEMIGGNPGEREPYGYVHFYKKRGIAVVRNPFIEPRTLKIKLDPAQGLCPGASSLVMERVYPSRWISPELTAAGASVEVTLQGYETVIYEFYPLETAEEPLLAGVIFHRLQTGRNDYKIRVRSPGKRIRLLNPEKVNDFIAGGRSLSTRELTPGTLGIKFRTEPVKASTMDVVPGKTQAVVGFTVEQSMTSSTLGFLLEPGTQVKHVKPGKRPEWKPGADVVIELDGKNVTAQVEQQQDRWAWYKVDLKDALKPGRHHARISIRLRNKKAKWGGALSAWMIYTLEREGAEVSIKTADSVQTRPMPPLPRAAGLDTGNIKLGQVHVGTKTK